MTHLFESIIIIKLFDQLRIPPSAHVLEGGDPILQFNLTPVPRESLEERDIQPRGRLTKDNRSIGMLQLYLFIYLYHGEGIISSIWKL